MASHCSMEERFDDYLASCLKDLAVKLAQAHRECMQQYCASLNANAISHTPVPPDSTPSLQWSMGLNNQSPLEPHSVVCLPPGSILEAPEPPNKECLTSADAVCEPKEIRKNARSMSGQGAKSATDAKYLSNECVSVNDGPGPSCGSSSVSGWSTDLDSTNTSVQLSGIMELSNKKMIDSTASANFKGVQPPVSLVNSPLSPRKDVLNETRRSRLDVVVPVEVRRSQVDEEHCKGMPSTEPRSPRQSCLSAGNRDGMVGGTSPRNSHKHTHFENGSENGSPKKHSVISTQSGMSCMTNDGAPFGVNKAWAGGSTRPSSVAFTPIHTGSVGNSNLRKSITMESECSFASSASGVHSQCMCCALVAKNVEKRMTKMVVDPGSPRRLVWDTLGGALICYEFVMVPLELMDVARQNFHEIMSWIIRIYWLFDLPICFIKGFYHPDGGIEVHVRTIVRKYVRSWMCFDLLVLVLDWVELLFGTENLSGARVARTMKVVRLHRIARLMRVIKFRNVPDFLRSVSTMFQSEMFQIMCSITQMMVVLVGVSHVLACFFYSMGIEGDGTSWTHHYGIESENLGSRYSTAMHWSVSQFTASSDIFPVTGGERAFAVVVMLFGFLISACVVSSITSSLTRLEIVAAGQSTQVSNLRQYLLNNNISTKTSMRVQRNAMFEIEQMTKNAPEGSIELLRVVSEPLRIELHYEIYMPVFEYHILFSCYSEFNATAMRRVCHTCVTKFHLSGGDRVFASGEIAETPCMYFHVSGDISYKKQSFLSYNEKRTVSLNEGDWACEAVIWTNYWAHLGTLQCMSPCSLLKLDAEKFQHTVINFHTHDFAKYAAMYVNRLNIIPKSSLWDLHMEEINVRQICQEVFPEWKDPNILWKVVGGGRFSTASSTPRSQGRGSTASGGGTDSTSWSQSHSGPLSNSSMKSFFGMRK